MSEIVPSHTGKRLLLLGPLATYMVVSLMLLLASIAARGAAGVIDYAPNTPVLAGIFFALPPILIAPVLARLIWQKTSEPQEVAPSRLFIWVAWIVIGVALTVAYIIGVGDVASYRTIDNRGLPQPIFGNEESFLGLSLMLGITEGVGLVVWTWYFCLRAFTRPQLDAVEGLDPMGEIMRTPT